METRVPFKKEIYDNGFYRGVIGRDRDGKWAIGWNSIPDDSTMFHYSSMGEAVEALRNRYPLRGTR